MPKLQKNQTENSKSQMKKKKDIKPKLIFIGKNKFHLKKIELFAKNNDFEFHTYSDKEWATLEEIDQYIQEEELSKQILTLPCGNVTVSSLDELEAETIKKVLGNVDGNIVKASRILKIARATLYRKMEKYGLSIKNQKEEFIKKQQEIIKKAA